jgi:hypothetical protein
VNEMTTHEALTVAVRGWKFWMDGCMITMCELPDGDIWVATDRTRTARLSVGSIEGRYKKPTARRLWNYLILTKWKVVHKDNYND